MADFYMHDVLADDILKQSKTNLIPDYVKMGAQGPDPFYFNVFGIDQMKSKKLADLMHEEKINEMLISMLHYVKTNYSLELHSFFVGFLTHYALDTTIHPYIYHHAGNYKKSDPLTKVHRGLHMKFERRVDIHFIYFIHKTYANQFPVCDIVFHNFQTSQPVLELMDYVASKVYNIKDAGHLYQKGYQRMRKICKSYVEDPRGLKKLMLSIADLFNKDEIIYLKDLSYYNYDEHFDYLNLNKETWHHPITNEAFNLSVLELYVRAYHRALIFIKETDAYLNNESSIDLEKLFGNMSLNTGISVSLNQKMKHFNLFKRKK
jgi:hypothetical protein